MFRLLVFGGTATPALATTPSALPTKASSRDVAREAILTGTKAGIVRAMNTLVADRSAPRTAREYAQYYLVRDAKQPMLRRHQLDPGGVRHRLVHDPSGTVHSKGRGRKLSIRRV